MTNKQIKVLEELLQDEGFKGKKMLRHLLWRNTTEPKYKKGDCFLVSDPGHRIYGHPVKNFKAKVLSASSFINEEEYQYELEMVVQCDGEEYTTKAYKYESELTVKCQGNVTVIGEPKTDCPECTDL